MTNEELAELSISELVEKWSQMPVSNRHHLMKCNPHLWGNVAKQASRKRREDLDRQDNKTKRIKPVRPIITKKALRFR